MAKLLHLMTMVLNCVQTVAAHVKKGQVVCIAGTGTPVEVDTHLVPGLGGLVEGGSPCGRIGGGLLGMVAGAFRVCG